MGGVKGRGGKGEEAGKQLMAREEATEAARVDICRKRKLPDSAERIIP